MNICIFTLLFKLCLPILTLLKTIESIFSTHINVLIGFYIGISYFLISAIAILFSAYQLAKVKKQLQTEQQKNVENSKVLVEKNKEIHHWQTQYFLNKKIIDNYQKALIINEPDDSNHSATSKESTYTPHASLEYNFKESAIYSLFHSKSTRIKEENWEELYTWLNRLYPDFISYLRHLHPTMSTQEFHISWLIKIGIPICRIAQILHLTSQAISHSRSRLYKKMTGKEGKAKDLDLLITNF